MKASKILFKEMAYLDTNKKPKFHSFTTDMLAKGRQLNSKCPVVSSQKIKALHYIKYPVVNIRKCLYFFLTNKISTNERP